MEASVQVSGTVLVVDDFAPNRTILSLSLRGLGMTVLEAPGGEECLEVCKRELPDIVLLDIMMPGIDGTQVLKLMREDDELREIPVIMLTGLDDNDVLVHCLRNGADDYLVKPYSKEVLTARIQAALKRKQWLDARRMLLNEEQGKNQRLSFDLSSALAESREAQRSVIMALAWLAEKRDPETGEHLLRVQRYCELMCKYLRLHSSDDINKSLTDSFMANLPSASVLHDIGKVGIPDAILLKPGRFTPEERVAMQEHTLIGADTLGRVVGQFPSNQYVALGCEVARWHHEKWDGSGYPDGLSGKQIPLSARIVAVADVYDAMRSKRCYKGSIVHEEVSSAIVEDSGKHFDPEIVQAFLQLKSSFDEVYADMSEQQNELSMQST